MSNLPTDRHSFKEYILRKLGAPVIKINVDNDQVEDRIDEALLMFANYHADGTEKVYYAHQITSDDVTNRYLQLPPGTIGAVRIFPLGTSFGLGDMFNIRYQIALNDLYNLVSVSMVPYYMTMRHLEFLEELLVGQKPVRYNRHDNKFYIDMDWNVVNPGDFIIVETYVILDPDANPDIWQDSWLLRYATALVKVQWADHMTKYSDVKMLGGQKFNAERILNDAQKERDKLEAELHSSYSLPCIDMIG